MRRLARSIFQIDRDASRRLGRGASRRRLGCIGWMQRPAGAFLAAEFASLSLPIG